jgi:hypothetical protein
MCNRSVDKLLDKCYASLCAKVIEHILFDRDELIPDPHTFSPFYGCLEVNFAPDLNSFPTFNHNLHSHSIHNLNPGPEFQSMPGSYATYWTLCMLPGCLQRFHSSREMLQHLKICPYLRNGEFCCPTCRKFLKYDTSPRKRSERDKTNWGKRIQKSFRNSVNKIRRLSGSSQATAGPSMQSSSPGASSTTTGLGLPHSPKDTSGMYPPMFDIVKALSWLLPELPSSPVDQKLSESVHLTTNGWPSEMIGSGFHYELGNDRISHINASTTQQGHRASLNMPNSYNVISGSSNLGSGNSTPSDLSSASRVQGLTIPRIVSPVINSSNDDPHRSIRSKFRTFDLSK